mmetsp:Transcript_7847/g.19474  ORF Transcript_7847/g.19474 Transcript_7847/m.19474 type:complete len:208 (+) Transcript_7847:303-926(+)
MTSTERACTCRDMSMRVVRPILNAPSAKASTALVARQREASRKVLQCRAALRIGAPQRQNLVNNFKPHALSLTLIGIRDALDSLEFRLHLTLLDIQSRLYITSRVSMHLEFVNEVKRDALFFFGCIGGLLHELQRVKHGVTFIGGTLDISILIGAPLNGVRIPGMLHVRPSKQSRQRKCVLEHIQPFSGNIRSKQMEHSLVSANLNS